MATVGATVRSFPGDLHAAVRGALVDRLVLTVNYSGGWSIVPPVMPPATGARSAAPRVLSERIVNGDYQVALEGIAGRSYTFRVLTPTADASAPVRVMSGEAGAIGVERVPNAPRARLVTVTFPSTGTPNSDNYVAASVRFSVASR